jgi:RHS repeat-associated protein
MLVLLLLALFSLGITSSVAAAMIDGGDVSPTTPDLARPAGAATVVAELIASRTSNTREYQLSDGTRKLEAVADAIATRQPLRYASYCYDSESGLYYLSARHYDPKTAQFLSKDPIKSDELSPFQYCAGNPATDVDPSGCSKAPAFKKALKKFMTYSTFLDWFYDDWAAIEKELKKFAYATGTAVTLCIGGTMVVLTAPPTGGGFSSIFISCYTWKTANYWWNKAKLVE